MKGLLLLVLCAFGVLAQYNVTCKRGSGSLYDFTVQDINGNTVKLSKYKGSVVLVTNVATFWGLTVPHYTDFNKLKAIFASYPFEIVGFPCAQFNNQEPGTNAEIPFGIKYVRPGHGYVPNFPLMSKIHVNGKDELPIYTWMKRTCGEVSNQFLPGVYVDWDPVFTYDITWNFDKFLFDKNGQLFKRYDPGTPAITLTNDIMLLATS